MDEGGAASAIRGIAERTAHAATNGSWYLIQIIQNHGLLGYDPKAQATVKGLQGR